MKRLFKHKGTWLVAAAVTLALCASAGTAMAYFTDYTSAAGGQTIRLEGTTEIYEEPVTEWTKHVTIANTGSTDVYVRAVAFAGSRYALEYSGAGWSLGADGYYYYDGIVPAGESAGELVIHIGGIAEDDEAFSVVVAQECVPVVYVDGAAQEADWSLAVSEEG